VVACVAAVALSACGGGTRQDANEPSGKFPVSVTTATFPASQRLAQQTHMVITVRNDGTKTIPNLAVTVCNVSCAYPSARGQGTQAQAFSQDINQAGLASNSRPVWIVDRPPGPCGYSCQGGGGGSNVTAYSNTWASGPLKGGQSVTFVWGVTAIQPGHHVVAYQVAAGLNGRARAVTSANSDQIPSGSFDVTISKTPAQAYVQDNGTVVTSP
jgi:peptidyl-tRNA hydrolase